MLKKYYLVVLQLAAIVFISMLILEAALQLMSFFINKENRGKSVLSNASFTLVTVGDSNTWGLFVEKNEAWPFVLQKKFDAAGQKVNVVNLAYPGTNSTQINKNFKSVLDAIDPDYVLFMGGINDGWSQLYFEDDAKSMAWIRENSRAYKAFLILYEGHFKNHIIPIEGGDRLIKERKELSNDQLNEKIFEMVNSNQKIGNKFFEINGELIHVGEKLVVDKNKSEEILEKISKGHNNTINYSIGEMVKKLNGTKTQLVIVTYPAYSGGYIGHKRYNELMREAANKYNLPLIENELPYFMNCTADITCNGYLLPDAHPSPSGHKLVAQHVFDRMSLLLR